jgi:L-amino acid N-acyltransferase YncA
MSNQTPVNPKEAARIFLDRLSHAYNGAIKGVVALLEKGPRGRKKQPHEVALHQWFQNLDEEGREHVLAIVRETANTTVFACLVLLDNKMVGYPLEGQMSDFAVYLQTYENEEAKAANSPETSTRLNLSYTPDGDLHDEFQYVRQ